jgi:imidazolonepropionase-like amidohydrolase
MSEETVLKGVYLTGMRDKRFDVTVAHGRFASVTQSVSGEPAEKPLWLAPGFIDLHLHLGWTDFDHADQLRRSPAETERMQGDAIAATCRAGVTTVRDAGGLLPQDAERIKRGRGLRIDIKACGAMLGAEDAGKIGRAVDDAAGTGARWIKIFATGGLGAPEQSVLDPLLPKDDFFAAVRRAHARGMKTMVHTWGGVTLDWAAEAGAETVEHCVYMTAEQAGRLAEAGIPCVPTAAIYRIASDPRGPLALPDILCRRALRAAEAQLKTVKRAKEAGVTIGFGTDFATPALHGKNLWELFALEACGLTRNEAWEAASYNGARILGEADRLGRIARGFAADAVIFGSDPLAAGSEKELRESIISVMKSGAWCGEPPEACGGPGEK